MGGVGPVPAGDPGRALGMGGVIVCSGITTFFLTEDPLAQVLDCKSSF
jgi:hypothetical protein